MLATAGVFISVAVTTGLVYLVLDVDLRTAIVLGAVASSTDAAAVFSVLRQLPVRGRLRATVEAESGFNDPPVIILVTVVASDAWNSSGPLGIAGQIGFRLVVGVLVGVLVAWAGTWVLVRSALPASGLYLLATLAIAFLAFAVSGVIEQPDHGDLRRRAGAGQRPAAAPVHDRVVHRRPGLALPDRPVHPARAAGQPSRPSTRCRPRWSSAPRSALVARPGVGRACATPFRMPWRDQVFVSWAGLRGAVPIVLATIPLSVGLPGAERIFDVVFLLVVLFTLIQGPTLPWVAKRTGAARPHNPRDVAIDSAALDDIDAAPPQFTVPERSR